MICRTTAPLVALGLVLVASSQALGAECSADRATFSGRGRMVEVAVEIADNPAERARGLMFRQELPQGRGMLFVYEQPQRVAFWMRNTLIPLAVAFLDEEGKILNIEEMKPQTENNHCAASAARFALEMNASWFSAKGIAVGTRIGGIEHAPSPQ